MLDTPTTQLALASLRVGASMALLLKGCTTCTREGQACSPYLDGLINEGHVEVAWDEASADALDLVGARLASRDDRALSGLHSHNLQINIHQPQCKIVTGSLLTTGKQLHAPTIPLTWSNNLH